MVDDNGTRIKGEIFSCGSGSLSAFSILDNSWEEKMTDAQALELGRKAIMHATYRDVGSGGNCNCELKGEGTLFHFWRRETKARKV